MGKWREFYEIYENRLKTFDSWYHAYLKQELAKAGFIYISTEDVVMCPFHEVVGYYFQVGDIPLADHYSWEGNCKFFRLIGINSTYLQRLKNLADLQNSLT